MLTCPNTSFLAVATYRLPGPVILSTRGTCSVPNAIAATACAPPALTMRVTPESRAAARISGETLPSRCGGVAIRISDTPASLAGMAFMSTLDG